MKNNIQILRLGAVQTKHLGGSAEMGTDASCAGHWARYSDASSHRFRHTAETQLHRDSTVSEARYCLLVFQAKNKIYTQRINRDIHSTHKLAYLRTHTHMHTKAIVLQFFANLPYMQIRTMCFLFLKWNVCLCVCALFSIKYWTSREFQWIPPPLPLSFALLPLQAQKCPGNCVPPLGPLSLSVGSTYNSPCHIPSSKNTPLQRSYNPVGVLSSSAVTDRSSFLSDIAGWCLVGLSQCHTIWCAFSTPVCLIKI